MVDDWQAMRLSKAMKNIKKEQNYSALLSDCTFNYKYIK